MSRPVGTGITCRDRHQRASEEILRADARRARGNGRGVPRDRLRPRADGRREAALGPLRAGAGVPGRFQREALAAARLSGRRNVVTVFDVGEHRGRPLIVMEYLDGGSIFDRLERGQVSREQALEWLTQTAAALDHAHAHGIVHRDVKPANLLLDRDGSVRVSDFGIASATGFETLTLPGMVLGTAGYLSRAGSGRAGDSCERPVRLRCRRVRAPHRPTTVRGRDPATQAFAHLHAEVPSATELDSSLPPAVDAVFARALAKEPAARPATCGELVADLRAAFASVDGGPEPTDGAPTPTLLLPATGEPTKLSPTGRPCADRGVGPTAPRSPSSLSRSWRGDRDRRVARRDQRHRAQARAPPGALRRRRRLRPRP